MSKPNPFAKQQDDKKRGKKKPVSKEREALLAKYFSRNKK